MKIFDWLTALETRLNAAELWVYQNVGKWPSKAVTWIFHGAMGFLLGLVAGEVGIGGAIGAYATREISQARKWGWGLDSTMDLLFPAGLSILGSMLHHRWF